MGQVPCHAKQWPTPPSLILHQSDLDIAVEKKFIDRVMDFTGLLYFLQSFRDIGDNAVTPRYHYGELCLSCLNFFSRVYHFKLFNHKVHWCHDDYFAQIIALTLFISVTILVALVAMQVVLATEQLDYTSTWMAFISTSQWYSVTCLFLAAACTIFFPTMVCIFLVKEFAYALLNMRQGTAP